MDHEDAGAQNEEESVQRTEALFDEEIHHKGTKKRGQENQDLWRWVFVLFVAL